MAAGFAFVGAALCAVADTAIALDTFVRQGDKHVVRHHLIDFGSTVAERDLRQ